jgi:hypothetical protein
VLVEVLTDPGSGPLPGAPLFALATPEAAVLVGADTVLDAAEGCSHGLAWFLRRLGAHLLTRATERPERSLPDCLADAVAETAALHGGRCDLSRPGTPSASVGVLRHNEGRVEHLLVGSAALLIRNGTDDSAVCAPDGAALHRVAARPSIAAVAETGSLPAADVRALALVGGDAVRPLLPGGALGPGLALNVLAESGAHELLARLRTHELLHGGGAHAPAALVHLKS